MAPDRPLPVETLLPFNQTRSPEITRSTLPELQLSVPNAHDHSQSPESQEDDDASGNEKPKRLKRSRACVACRNMKIRCLPVDGQEACKACSKVNRQCVMPGPPRKRQKTVHKVAELEKKINALTDALLAKQADATKPEEESPPKDAPTNSSSERARTEDTANTSMDTYQRGVMDRIYNSTTTAETTTTLAEPRFVQACDGVTFDPPVKEEYIDAVDRGVLTMDTATSLFDFWTDSMAVTNPLVVFPPGTDAQQLRKTRPITFLTTLTIAAAVIQPLLHPSLTTELSRQISERVLFHGDKSLDLIQALLLNSQYYVRPREARDLAFNANISAACTMALELGIGKRSKMNRTPSEQLELARTWLACYQASITVNTILRLPILIKYGPRVEECIEILNTSPLAAPTDKWLCAQVGISRIAEEVSTAFEMDDPGAELTFTAPRIQYQLKCFQKLLRDCEKSTDGVADPRLMRHLTACVNLYMHEIAIHEDHNVDDFRLSGPSTENRKQPDIVTARQVEALSILLASSHQVLDTYLSLEVECARTLSNLYIVWCAYAVVILIKLHSIFNLPDSKFGAFLLPDLKTGSYVDAVLNRLGEMAENGRSPCAAAFGFVFMKLKIWHLHRSGQLPDDDPSVVGGDDLGRRMRASSILQQEPLEILGNAKRMEIAGVLGPSVSRPATDSGISSGQRPPTPAFAGTTPGSWNNAERFVGQTQFGQNLGQNLNAAYDAASYGRTNWDQFNFSTEELDMFDVYMNNSGWMGYLI